jgi:hypothetical protein
MTVFKLVQFVVLLVSCLSLLVVALWIFPRLYLATHSTRIANSIRRHPIIHIVWGLIGLAVGCLFLWAIRPVVSE